jgi:hypothetical protein
MKTRNLLCLAVLLVLTSIPCPAATVETPGFLKFECWFPPLRDAALTGTDVTLLDFDPNYVANLPDMTSYAAGLNSRGVFPDDSHEQYGARLTGWITPTVTGDYYFYLRSDDASQLWISTDASESHLQLAAEEIGYGKPFQEPGALQTTISPLHLVAGQKFAIRVLLKEGTGNDYVQVAMQPADGTAPASSLLPWVSTLLSASADPAGASLTITQQPAAVSTPENAPAANFSIAANAVTPYGKYTSTTNITNTFGQPLKLGTKTQIATFYQWFTNGVEVPGANSATFSISWPKKAQNGTKVKCYVAVPGIPLYSSEVALTVTSDTTPPGVVKATSDATFTNVVVTFSEPVTDTALLASRYALNQGVTISSVERVDLITVRLNTTRMSDGKTYTLTVNGVQDTSTPPNTIVANTQLLFKSWVFVPGIAIRHKYTGFDDTTGNDVNNLFNDPRYPNSPDRIDVVKRMEYPSDGVGLDTKEVPDTTTGASDKFFFDAMDCWFVPPADGNYVFLTAAPDRMRLFLSTDENPSNRYLIASANTWTGVRTWTTDWNGANLTPACRSDQYTGTQWPSGNTITLQGGKRYYLLLTHHMPSWAGGQWLAATYKKESDPDPATGTVPTLEKNAIGSYMDPSVGNVTFSLQPTNVSVDAGTKATFKAMASGYSAYTTNLVFQWQSAPKGSSVWTDISGATTTNYTTGYLGGADDGTQLRLVATAAPISATSSVAVITVKVDLVPPTVVKASTDLNWTNVTVKFSEPVSDTALVASRYQMDKGTAVTAVTRIDSLTVKLVTSKLTESQVYSLTINGVQDTASPPNTIAANTKTEVRTLVFLLGNALHQKYTNVDMATGSSPNGLFNDPRFPNNADRKDLVQRWEYPANGVARDQITEPTGVQYRLYFDTIEGYFIPPTNGNYVFFIAGADRFWLFLSTDDSPANKYLIAAQPGGWTNPRNWVTGQGNTDMTMQRSDTYAATAWPFGHTITLEAGKRYYMLSIHHDTSGAGADDFAATYKMEGDPDPKNGDVPKFAGNLIGYYFDPSGASVSFAQQPQNASATQGGTVTFTAAATGLSVYGTNVFYQWQSAPKGSANWTDIAGATAASYQTPILGLTDDGRQYRLVATVPPYSSSSAAVTVTVAADTTPPIATVGAMQDDTAGVVDVGVGFNETVDSVAGQLLANYSVSPGTITGLSWQTNGFTANSRNPLAAILKQTALLKVTGLTGSGILTIKNLTDLYGNKVASINVPFAVDTKMKWGVVGANEFGGWNAVVPVAPNGFDIYSDGMGAWSNFDEATFVYEPVTGDFDKKLRVAYQDGSSQWARAGLIVKELTGFGMNRATQTNNAVRYQKCLVYPVGATLSGPGTLGSAVWSLNRRLDVGGATDAGSLTGANAVPAYPNAWCRIKRVGQTFTMYRSDDGVTWVTLGTTTWGVDDVAKKAMPATLYVGPDFAPELGNITNTSDRGTFLAQIRDYGDYVSVFAPQLKVAKDNTGKVTITWTTGTLVSSPTVTGTYTPVNATNTYVVTPAAGTATFYRVKQ